MFFPDWCSLAAADQDGPWRTPIHICNPPKLKFEFGRHVVRHAIDRCITLSHQFVSIVSENNTIYWLCTNMKYLTCLNYTMCIIDIPWWYRATYSSIVHYTTFCYTNASWIEFSISCNEVFNSSVDCVTHLHNFTLCYCSLF